MLLKSMFILLLFVSIAKISPAQTRRALIIAIGNYPNPDQNQWPVINSANDVPLVKNALISSQHFSEQNIKVLIDSQATKKGIIEALDKLVLSANKGDIMVIHISSHGEQIEDDNNDEIDGLDEVIVPYGAVFSTDPARFKSLADGYLRDDLFGEKINQLRNKIGKNGDLLVTIDACHSGSGTRGVHTAKIRGGNLPMVSNTFNAGNYTAVDASVFKESTSTKLNVDASSFVLISGAQAKESNYECYDDNDKPAGSLSYAFSKALSSLKGPTTYQGFFSMIETIMHSRAPLQKPVLEGDALNRDLFGGKYEKQQPYFSINQSQSSNQLIVLNGGYVAGITTGSEIDFYEAGTTNVSGTTLVGTGKVISATSFTSTVKPDSNAATLAKLNPWAFIKELSYGAEKLKLFVKGNNSIAAMLRDSLKNIPMVAFDSACDLFLDTAVTINKWALKYPNTGTVFQAGFSFPGTESVGALKSALKRYDRFRYIKGLQFNEPGIAATVQLVFIDDKGQIDSPKLNARMHFGRLELKENDKVYLRIINTGSRQCYINIVDIQPDGFINPILPNKNVKDKNGNPAPVKWEDCLLKREDTLFLRNISIDIQKPYGEETFKIFLSSQPLDLEDVLTTKNEGEAKNKRGVLNGLEKIFVDSNINESGTRGGSVTKITTEQNGTIFSLNFQILPK